MRHLRRHLPLLLGVLLPVMLVFGIWLGAHPGGLPSPVRDVFVGDSADDVVREGLDLIEDDYYRKVPAKELANQALSGAVDGLGDRFSDYFDPESYKRFQDSTDSAFSGVGLSVTEDKRGLKVLEVFARSPAAGAGIERDDYVIAVNGQSIAGKSARASTALIRGVPGTTVTLRVLSGKEEINKQVKRARVEVPVVKAAMRELAGTKVAHVRLGSFTSGAHGEVRTAIDRLRNRGAKAVILDLRNNGGGLLNEAVLVSSIFIPEGTIVSIDGRSRDRRVFQSTGNSIPGSVPVVVLVNEGSASASEIVAGAIKDRNRGQLVGTRTFGKGVFQEIKPLSNGGALDITVGQYFTPSGRNLGGVGVKQGKGLPPDVQAEDESKTERDEALAIAVRTVVKTVS